MHVHGLPAPAAGSGARPHALLHGTMRSTKGLACSQRISACGRPADSDVAGACRHAQQTGRSLQRMPPALRRRLCRRGRPPPPVSAQVERRAARAAACDARAAGDGQPGCAGRVGLGCRTSSGRPLRRNSSEPAARSRSRTSDTASSRKVALAGPVGGQPPAPYCSHRRGQLGRAGARGRGAGAPCLSAGRQAGGPPTVKRGSMRV